MLEEGWDGDSIDCKYSSSYLGQKRLFAIDFSDAWSCTSSETLSPLCYIHSSVAEDKSYGMIGNLRKLSC